MQERGALLTPRGIGGWRPSDGPHIEPDMDAAQATTIPNKSYTTFSSRVSHGNKSLAPDSLMPAAVLTRCHRLHLHLQRSGPRWILGRHELSPSQTRARQHVWEGESSENGVSVQLAWCRPRSPRMRRQFLQARAPVSSTQVRQVETRRALQLCGETQHHLALSHDKITRLRLALLTETSCNVRNRSCDVAVGFFPSFFWISTGQVSLRL